MLRLPVALALTLALATPALAMNQRKPDCSKVPGHPDCVYPAAPAHNYAPTAEQPGVPKAPASK